MSEFAFVADNRFLRSGPPTAATPYVIAGLAFDGAVTNRPGARFGPRAIRSASQMLCDATHPHFDVSPLGLLGDAGDLPLPTTALSAMREAVAGPARALIAAHHMCWLGGDHSVTLPLLRAYRAHLGAPLAVIHFDAHCDTWRDHFGEPSGHGTWVREAFEAELVVPEAFVQIGIRSSGDREAREYVQHRGGLIHTARSLRGLASPQQLAPVIASIHERIGARPVYLSLDVDCLDPAFAPGTGTPEPGGLSTGQVLTLIEETTSLNFVGMDCVEVAPVYDHAELTSQAAAHFVWSYLCGRIAATTPAAAPSSS